MPPMNTPKIKPTIPSIRLLVRAWPYLPASMAFTVDQAKKARTMAGMNRNRKVSDMIPKKGTWRMFEGFVAEPVGVTAEKTKTTTRRPSTPAAAAKT